MARQTRAQRRARRARQGEPVEATAIAPPRARQQIRPVPAEPPKAEAAPRHIPGAGGKRFVAESWAELKKVDWPNQSQIIQGTVVVLVACAIVGVYLWGADLILKRLVEKVFLGQ